MQKALIIIVALILVLAGGTYLYAQKGAQPVPTPEVVVCTMDAKMCPDGSYVGRTGPSCEFAACPAPAATSTNQTSTTIDTQINKKVTVLGVSIYPLEVEEDSRCPQDVQCIQAGTVRLRATVEGVNWDRITLFTLGKPVTTPVGVITLLAATPMKLSTHELTQADYRFTFEIRKNN